MQQHRPNLNHQPQVLTIGKPTPYNNSFNPSLQNSSFNQPANTRSTHTIEQSNFTLQDFLFIPKLLNLGRDVHTMTSQGLCDGDVDQQVSDRFTAIHNHPNIALNVNVHVLKASDRQSNCNVPPAKSYQFLVNVGNVQVKEKFKPHLDTNIESKSMSNEKVVGEDSGLSPAKSQDLASPGKCNFKSNKFVTDTACTLPNIRIKKRKTCNCIKRRPLEELMRQERSFNKQVERIRHFWKGENCNHPFMFKKKLMDYYNETDEAIISEVLDFSKKAINAEDLQISISDK